MILDHKEKLAMQSIMNDKMQEKKKYTTLESDFSILKKNIESEIKKWNTAYKKSQNNERTKCIVKKGYFEGNKANQIKRLYQGHVTHMNSNYIGKMMQVCTDLEKQITNIKRYINELEGNIETLKNKINQISD